MCLAPDFVRSKCVFCQHNKEYLCKLALVGKFLIKFYSLSAPTKNVFFSSDPAVSSSIFVGAERE